MSTNSNFRKDKCWSCEFFCGHRQYKKGILFGDSVETDSQGSCANNRSSNNGKTVRENDWCSKYQKWGVLQSAIAKQEVQQEQARQAQQQREQERIQQEQNAERLRQDYEDTNRIYSQIASERTQIEAEHKRLEQERKALEHERWYSSLSPEEREKYDAEQARLKAERAERERLDNERRIEQERLRAIEREEKQKQEEVAKRKRKRNIIIVSCIVVGLIILAICLPTILSSIKKNNTEKAFNASSTGKVLNYIRAKSNGKDEYSFTTSVDDIQLEFTIQYLANGFDAATGIGSYSKGEGRYSFMAVTKVGNRKDYEYSACYGTAIFNWDNLCEMKNMYFVGEVWYNQYSVFNHYQRYSKGDHCPAINYDGVYHNYGSWDKALDLEEAKKVGWDACEMTLIFLNQISNEVLSSNLW